MKKIVSIICENPVGGSFVDWSIHYLSNKEQYFRWPACEWQPLVENPLNGINAHGHTKNHPWGADATTDFFNDVVSDSDNNALYSCYPLQLPFQSIAKKLNLDIHKIADKEIYSALLDYDRQDTVAMVDLCFNRSSHVIYLETKSQNLPLLTYFNRQLDLRFTDLSKPANEQELFDEQDQLWNTPNMMHWNSLGLTEIWDKRERIALNIRPIGEIGNDCVADSFYNVDFSQKHHRVGVRDLWCRGDQTLLQIMKYLELEIDPLRWKQWQLIYDQWSAQQATILHFLDNLSYILDAIVNNWYYCLPNLTFRQEVLIQHFLIYKYNLNLKTWQLTKFPSNTQDLHLLLEPNLHPTTLLY